ncbi:hypothetical protein E9531_04355 [Lampropedia puyangensis]|uniref:Uncharacterized protein n=2 Tax=Lampropedia puyangensis TaxID=1330072 RepID=A0A4S8FCA7_9BURK|nr:hypothetical protein E9531_04355 [Lampropedia puyangensis]
MRHMIKHTLPLVLIGCCMIFGIAGCASPYAGVSVPVGPVSIGVGASNAGVSLGVGAGAGPVGVGVGVNQKGQVSGSAGVGASTRIGGSNARVGAGIGSSTVLYDPTQSTITPSAPPSQHNTPTMEPMLKQNAENDKQWRDATGRVVPACKVQGQC